MNIFLTKGDEKNLDKTIKKPIDINILKKADFSEKDFNFVKENSINNEIYCWAATSTQNNIKYKILKPMAIGDLMLFSQSGSGKFSYYGIISLIVINKNLNNILWDEKKIKENKKWDFIIFFKNIKKLTPPTDEKYLMNKLNSNYNLQTPYILSDKQKSSFKKIFPELMIENEFVNPLLKEEINEGIHSEIRKIKELDVTDIVANFDNKPIKVKNKDKKTVNKINKSKNKKTDTLSDSEKKTLGFKGEQIAYNSILKNPEILKALKIHSSDIKEFTWFNNDVDIYEENWKDKSIGKGCDIVIETINKNIMIEVKSSFNKINEITLTQNELKAMKENASEDTYFLLLVSELKNLNSNKVPNLMILKNFSKDFLNSYIDSSKAHILYAQKLLEEYKLF